MRERAKEFEFLFPCLSKNEFQKKLFVGEQFSWFLNFPSKRRVPDLTLFLFLLF
jgi:hypothetical protein